MSGRPEIRPERSRLGQALKSRCLILTHGLSPRIWVAGAATLLVFLIVSCGGSGETPPQETAVPTSIPAPLASPTPITQPSQASPTPSQEDDSVNLIAYVGPDDNIYTIRPDGSNPELLTIPMSGETASLSGAGLFNSHTIYNWTTWSPDATKIAFTSYAANGDVTGTLLLSQRPGVPQAK